MRKKKAMVFSMVILILLIFTACGDKENKKGVQGQDIQKSKEEYIYQPSFQNIAVTLDGVSKTCIGNGHIYMIGYRNKENKKGYIVPAYFLVSIGLDDGNIEEMEINIKEKEDAYSLFLGDKNQLSLLTKFSTFDFDKEKTIEKYYMHLIDLEKKVDESFQLKIKKSEGEEELFIRDIIIVNDMILFNSKQEVYVFDLQGKQKNIYDFGNYTGAITYTGKGEIYVSGYNKNAYGLKQLDLEKEEFGNFINLHSKNIYRTQGGNYNVTLYGGKEDRIYINDSNSVHCYHTETQEFTTLFNWLNNNIDGNSVYKLFPTENEEFFIINYNGQNGETGKEEIKVTTLGKVKASLVKEKTILKLSCIYVTNAIKQNILSFNERNTNYRIELHDYSGYEDPATRLNLDIIAGEIPDILSIDSLPVLQYIKKGILTDLYPLMEQDQEINKEDFIETVINTLEREGKLYYIGSDFSVRPLLGSRKLVGDIEAWTVDDMIALYEHLPKDGLFLCNDTYNMSRQLFLKNILNNQLEDYVKMDTKETRLDSEEFIKILEFSKNFPDENDIAEDIFDRFKIGMPIMVQKRKLMFSDCFNLSFMPDIQSFMKMYQKVGGFTVLNYPSIEGDDGLSMTLGNNTMAITEKCKNKEAAWEFLRMFLTYPYQKSKGFYEGIPTRKDAFDKMLEYSMIKEAFTDSDGMLVEPINIQYNYDDYTVMVGPLKEEEIDRIRSIVGRIKKCTYNDSVVQEINKIVIEEAETFFSGDKTAEEAALIMQNRVKIYVSENS